MNGRKKILEAVKVFNRLSYPLLIVGKFTSDDLYEQVNANKSENITIENRFVSDNEYYTLLGTSKYCLVPYDPDFYLNRTSGVLQECLFMETIPVSHKRILEFSNIKGIAYEEMLDLLNIDFNKVDTFNILESNNYERDLNYNYEVVKSKTREVLKKMENNK